MTRQSPPSPRPLPFPPGGVVVSCQAPQDSPFRDPRMMAAMASAAQLGGAVAIRTDGPEDVAAVAAATSLPILGINKVGPREGVYITPTYESAAAVVAAGAAMVAVDGTGRPRPGGETLARLVSRVHEELGVPVMADCDSMASAHHAAAAGCDVLASTLAGYSGGRRTKGPDLALIREMVEGFDLPVVAEGRYGEPEHVAAAFEAGAHSVVVGTAITNPIHLTRRFVAVSPLASHAPAFPS